MKRTLPALAPKLALAPMLAFALGLAAACVTSTTAHASGGEFSIPWTIDPYGGTPSEQDAFYNGNVGILMGRAPWPRLFAGWRMVHGMAVGADAGKTLALPCCDVTMEATDAAVHAWLDARKAIPNAPAIQYDTINVYRQVGDFMSVQTCFPDAFATAARTLADRIAAHGAADPWVRSWLDGQDIVFQACSESADLPPLDPTASDWLKADRSYQAAALALYRRDFATAQRLFEAVAADATSPWRKLAPYLAARAAVDAALPTSDPALFEIARTRLAALAPDDIYGHADLPKLSGALDFRDRADVRRRELAQALTAPALPPSVAANFKDSRRLGQSPPGDPAYLDWLAVFGRAPDQTDTAWFDHYAADQVWKTDAEALAHAKARWTDTKDQAWLLAALEWTDPGPAAADLIAAARVVKPTDPAFLTALYHRIRLDTDAAPDVVRADLETALGTAALSQTSRNLLMAERTLVAADLADLARLAPRISPCVKDDGNGKDCVGPDFKLEGLPYSPDQPDIHFGDEAVAIIDRLPLPDRVKLAGDPILPAPLRLDIGLTDFTRAALLQDWPTVLHLAKLLQPLLPQLDAEWKSLQAAKTPQETRFASWFVLAKMPGMDVDLGGSYTRPQGALADFDGHWHDWLYAPTGAASVPPADVKGDLICFGMCGPGAFPFHLPAFVAATSTDVAAERGRYLPADPKTAASVWEDVLAYAKAHPNDPRSPEALYWLVRISRYGTGHNRSSYRAFVLLHARYKDSTWAKQSRYFYD